MAKKWPEKVVQRSFIKGHSFPIGLYISTFLAFPATKTFSNCCLHEKRIPNFAKLVSAFAVVALRQNILIGQKTLEAKQLRPLSTT